MVKSIGADEVIDYAEENFDDPGESYDVIFDSVGKIAPSQRKIPLKNNGIFLDALSSSADLKLKAEDVYLPGTSLRPNRVIQEFSI